MITLYDSKTGTSTTLTGIDAGDAAVALRNSRKMRQEARREDAILSGVPHPRRGPVPEPRGPLPLWTKIPTLPAVSLPGKGRKAEGALGRRVARTRRGYAIKAFRHVDQDGKVVGIYRNGREVDEDGRDLGPAAPNGWWRGVADVMGDRVYPHHRRRAAVRRFQRERKAFKVPR